MYFNRCCFNNCNNWNNNWNGCCGCRNQNRCGCLNPFVNCNVCCSRTFTSTNSIE